MQHQLDSSKHCGQHDPLLRTRVDAILIHLTKRHVSKYTNSQYNIIISQSITVRDILRGGAHREVTHSFILSLPLLAASRTGLSDSTGQSSLLVLEVSTLGGLGISSLAVTYLKRVQANNGTVCPSICCADICRTNQAIFPLVTRFNDS